MLPHQCSPWCQLPSTSGPSFHPHPPCLPPQQALYWGWGWQRPHTHSCAKRSLLAAPRIRARDEARSSRVYGKHPACCTSLQPQLAHCSIGLGISGLLLPVMRLCSLDTHANPAHASTQPLLPPVLSCPSPLLPSLSYPRTLAFSIL